LRTAYEKRPLRRGMILIEKCAKDSLVRENRESKHMRKNNKEE
jgi:hypothetical protein